MSTPLRTLVQCVLVVAIGFSGCVDTTHEDSAAVSTFLELARSRVHWPGFATSVDIGGSLVNGHAQASYVRVTLHSDDLRDSAVVLIQDNQVTHVQQDNFVGNATYHRIAIPGVDWRTIVDEGIRAVAQASSIDQAEFLVTLYHSAPAQLDIWEIELKLVDDDQRHHAAFLGDGSRLSDAPPPVHVPTVTRGSANLNPIFSTYALSAQLPQEDNGTLVVYTKFDGDTNLDARLELVAEHHGVRQASWIYDVQGPLRVLEFIEDPAPGEWTFRIGLQSGAYQAVRVGACSQHASRVGLDASACEVVLVEQ